jgi:hypothetical protein
MLFLGAPRLHNGLGPDEYPAILQYGERVQSRSEVAASRSGPNVSVNITNNSQAQVEAVPADVQFDGQRLLVGMILKDRRNNGPMSRGKRN